MSLLAGDGHMDACVTGSVSPAIVPSARTLEVTLERLYQWTFQRDFRWKLQSGEGTASTSQQTARKSLSPSTPSLWAVFIWAAVGKQRLCRYRAWHSWGVSPVCPHFTPPLIPLLLFLGHLLIWVYMCVVPPHWSVMLQVREIYWRYRSITQGFLLENEVTNLILWHCNE